LVCNVCSLCGAYGAGVFPAFDVESLFDFDGSFEVLGGGDAGCEAPDESVAAESPLAAEALESPATLAGAASLPSFVLVDLPPRLSVL